MSISKQFYATDKPVKNNIKITPFGITAIIIVLGYVCGTELKTSGEDNPNGILIRHRRQIFRGQDNYYQRGYDLNRLKYEKHVKKLGPRRKSFHFWDVDDNDGDLFGGVYERPDLINQYENFDDRRKASATKDWATKSVVHDQRFGDNRFARRDQLISEYYQTETIRNQQPRQALSQQQDYQEPRSRMQMQSQSPVYYVQPDSQLKPRRQSFRQPIGRVPFVSRTPSRFPTRTPVPDLSSSFGPDPDPVSFPVIPNPQPFPPEIFPRSRNSTYVGIPGYIRRDFPGYYQIPYTGFRCDQAPYYGYYADTAAGCQVFHVCQTDGRHDQFLCPNGTLFHQKVMTCDWWYHVDCPSSPQFYFLNARIGVLPPQPATLHRFP